MGKQKGLFPGNTLYKFHLNTFMMRFARLNFPQIPFADFLNHDGTSESIVLSDDDKHFSEVLPPVLVMLPLVIVFAYYMFHISCIIVKDVSEFYSSKLSG